MTEMKTAFEYDGSAGEAPEICQTLSLRPMFWRPAYLETSAWLEHIPFAFWLMAAHRPKVFVELGSHYGVSYFAFCQAVERLGMDTHCFAVDTWKGDEHAGFYDEKVFAQVRSHNDANYSGFSRLVRSTFDDALGHFSDGSIDLLHIDGLHTYEAVKHDFEAWLPKLSENAVIVMHDTNVRERNFGVFRLFEELKKTYPAFEFAHGHGLGVLAIKPLQNSLLQRLFDAESDKVAKHVVQEMFSRLGRANADALAAVRDHETAQKLTGDVNKHAKQIDDLKQTLEKTKTDFTNRSKELNETRAKLQKQAEENAGERAQLIERTTLLEELRKEQKDEIVQLRTRIDQLETRAASQAEELRRAEAFAASQKQSLADTAAVYEKQLALLNATVVELNERHEHQSGAYASLQSQLVALETENASLKLAQVQEQAQVLDEIAALKDARTREQALLQDEIAALKDAQAQEQALLQDEIAALKEARDQEHVLLQNEIAVLKDARTQEQALLQDEIGALESARDRANSLADQANTALQVAEQEIARLSSENQSISEENLRLAADLQQAQQIAEQMRAASAEAEENLRQQEVAVPTALKEEVQRLGAENAELHAENQKLAASVDLRFQELAKLTQMLATREGTLHTQKVAGEKIKAQLRVSEEQLGKVKEQLRKSETLMQKREGDFQLLLQQLAQLAMARSATKAKTGRLVKFANTLGGKKGGGDEERFARQAALLRQSGLFDEAWYLTRYPDVGESKLDPAVHYLRFGAAEKRDPGPFFSTESYIARYPDVAESNINPLVHYINHGSKEARIIKGSQAK